MKLKYKWSQIGKLIKYEKFNRDITKSEIDDVWKSGRVVTSDGLILFKIGFEMIEVRKIVHNSLSSNRYNDFYEVIK